MIRLKVVVSAAILFCLLGVLPLFAVRRPDVPSSKNGEVVGVPAELCPSSTATPFFAVLDGTTVGPVKGTAQGECNPADQNKPNPPFSPATYPNLSVTLSGSGFTVTVTPALWTIGLGATSNAADKYTVFQVQFSGQNGMTLQSLLIGTKLSGATYVPCVPSQFGTGIPYCVDVNNTLQSNADGTQYALEPAPIDEADGTTTRWDFSQFSSGTLALAVAGFPSEFRSIDRYTNSNALTAASFAPANFLAIVIDASNNVFTAGGLTVPKKAPAAPNDLFADAIKITKVPFKSVVDTSATSPSEVLSGAGAGGEINSQGDPTPQDPSPVTPGNPCDASWPAGASVFRSVWYAFTPSASNNYQISTAGSRYDTGVYVFTGSPSSPVTVACNDDAFTTVTQVQVQSSDVNFGATAGTTYYVMVSEVPPPVGTDTATGTIPLAAPLANDATLDFSLTVGSPAVMSPNSVVNFPNQPIHTHSTPIAITATNTTASNATVARVSIYGSGAGVFSQTNNCLPTLAAFSQCTINVTFTPLVKGIHVANLQLQFNGAVNPLPLTLTGTGD